MSLLKTILSCVSFSHREKLNIFTMAFQGPTLVLAPLPPSQITMTSAASPLPFANFFLSPFCVQNTLGMFPLRGFAHAFPSAQNALSPIATKLSFYLPQIFVQKFPSQFKLPSRTGYIVYGTQCKTKMQGPLFRKYH